MAHPESMAATPANIVTSPLMNTREAAAYLRIARSTFTMKVAPGLPRIHPTPGRTLFRKADLDALIEEQAQVAP